MIIVAYEIDLYKDEKKLRILGRGSALHRSRLCTDVQPDYQYVQYGKMSQLVNQQLPKAHQGCAYADTIGAIKYFIYRCPFTVETAWKPDISLLMQPH